MTATTDDIDARTPSRRASLTPALAADLVAYVGAAAFVVAAIWYGLTARFITVAKPPAVNPNATLDAELHRWFNWFVATLPQERLDVGIAIAGFLCLVPLGAFAGDLLGRHRVLARIGSLALPTGALLWAAGNVLQLGGHRAVGLMATHRNPIETVNAILFTVDTIDDAFDLAAFAVLGVALLAFAGAVYAGYTVLAIGSGRARRTQLNWVVTGFGAAVNIGLNFWLIPQWGMVGASISTAAAYVVLFVGMMLYAQRVYPVPYQWRRIVTCVGAAVGLSIAARAAHLPLAPSLLLVLAYPVALAALGFYLPAERKRLLKLVPSHR